MSKIEAGKKEEEKAKNLKLTKIRLCIGRLQLLALNDANETVTTNMAGVARGAAKFYTEVNSDQGEQEEREGRGGGGKAMELGVYSVAAEKVNNALKGTMIREKHDKTA